MIKFFENAANVFESSVTRTVKNFIKDKAQVQIVENFEQQVKYPFGSFGTTFRRNGTIITGSPRDAIDTGTLLDSVVVSWGGDTLYVRTDTPYAPYVFYGFVTRSGRLVPPRIDKLLRVNVQGNAVKQ